LAAGDGALWAIIASDRPGGAVTFWQDTAQGFVALPFAACDG
jgi:hypothetical protein